MDAMKAGGLVDERGDTRAGLSDHETVCQMVWRTGNPVVDEMVSCLVDEKALTRVEMMAAWMDMQLAARWVRR